MATLTADELSYVRSMLPTTDTTDPAYVTDSQLNYLYANKADSDVDKTIAYAMRQMCIKLSRLVARTNTATGDTVQQQQEREAVCAQADSWARMTGIPGGSGGVLTTGTLLFNLDADEDDLLATA
jgi:hypothetical protein